MADIAQGQQTDTPPRDFQPSPDAADTADALRSGLALRRREAPGAGADAARLTALGDLDSLGAVAKPGAAAPLVKLGRRVLLVFLRPWLSMQTMFNREVARRFDDSVTMVRDVRRRMPLVEDALHALDERLHALERGTHAGRAPTASSLDAAFVPRLFVQSRLPPPPASVLVLPGVAAEVLDDLTHLGYRVESASDVEADAFIGTLDDPQGAFDLMARARLRSHARGVLLAAAMGAAPALSEGLTGRAAAAGWRVEEWLVSAGNSWAVVAAPAAGDVVVGLVLRRHRQADAPAR
jgi:hypothetical protein